MTQAINLANFSNSLDTSGGVPPSQLNAPVPLSKGGTNGTTAASARTNLGSTAVGDAVFIAANAAAARTAIGTVIGTDVPSPTGTGASGTWNINVTGSASSATTAGTATTAGNVTGTVAIANGGTGQTTAANAGSALGAIGVGQTWQVVTRAAGTTYTNSTGRPIMVAISISDGGSGQGSYSFTISGVTVVSAAYDFGAFFSLIVPDGATYSCALSNAGIGLWRELR